MSQARVRKPCRPHMLTCRDSVQWPLCTVPCPRAQARTLAEHAHKPCATAGERWTAARRASPPPPPNSGRVLGRRPPLKDAARTTEGGSGTEGERSASASASARARTAAVPSASVVRPSSVATDDAALLWIPTGISFHRAARPPPSVHPGVAVRGDVACGVAGREANAKAPAKPPAGAPSRVAVGGLGAVAGREGRLATERRSTGRDDGGPS